MLLKAAGYDPETHVKEPEPVNDGELPSLKSKKQKVKEGEEKDYVTVPVATYAVISVPPDVPGLEAPEAAELKLKKKSFQ